MAEAKAKKKQDNDEPVVVTPGPRTFAVPGNDLTGYLGVSPEYMTYASPTSKPIMTREEAMLYTNLTDEEIDEVQKRKPNKDLGVEDHEAPAIVDNSEGFVSQVQQQPAGQVTYDPGAGYSAPGVLTDEQEKAIADGDKEVEGEGSGANPGSTEPTKSNVATPAASDKPTGRSMSGSTK